MPTFRNHYLHDDCPRTPEDEDDPAWTDTWDCACNDRCPKCGAEIEPHFSEDVSGDDPEAERAERRERHYGLA